MKWATKIFSWDSLFVRSILMSHGSWRAGFITMRVQLHEIDRQNSINRFYKVPTSSSRKVILESYTKLVQLNEEHFTLTKLSSCSTIDYRRQLTSIWKLNCHFDIFLKAHAAWARFNLLSCSWIWIIWWDFWARYFVVERKWLCNERSIWKSDEKFSRLNAIGTWYFLWLAYDWLNKWAIIFMMFVWII